MVNFDVNTQEKNSEIYNDYSEEFTGVYFSLINYRTGQFYSRQIATNQTYYYTGATRMHPVAALGNGTFAMALPVLGAYDYYLSIDVIYFNVLDDHSWGVRLSVQRPFIDVVSIVKGREPNSSILYGVSSYGEYPFVLLLAEGGMKSLYFDIYYNYYNWVGTFYFEKLLVLNSGYLALLWNIYDSRSVLIRFENSTTLSWTKFANGTVTYEVDYDFNFYDIASGNGDDCVATGQMTYDDSGYFSFGCPIVKFNCLSGEILWAMSIMRFNGDVQIECNSITKADAGGYVMTGYLSTGEYWDPYYEMFTVKVTENGEIEDNDLPDGLTCINVTDEILLSDFSRDDLRPSSYPVTTNKFSVSLVDAAVRFSATSYKGYCQGDVSEWAKIAPVIALVSIVLIVIGFYDEKNRVDAPWKKIEPDAAPSKINETNEGVANHMNAVGLYAHNPMMGSNRGKSHVKEMVYG